MHLFAPTQAREIPRPREPGCGSATPPQIRMIAQRQRIEADTLRLIMWTRSHRVDRQGLIELSERPQRCKSGVEMRSRGKHDAFLRPILPMAHGDHHGNLEVSGDV